MDSTEKAVNPRGIMGVPASRLNGVLLHLADATSALKQPG